MGKAMPGSLLSDQRWLQAVARSQPRLAELLGRSPDEQKKAGYLHTLHEILQQPTTWIDTSERLTAASADLARLLESVRCVVLTGSGSSEYVGDCVCVPLQQELGVVVEVIGGGALLANGVEILPPLRPAVVVSLGRSGDSPESVAAVSRLLQTEPKIQHLVLTCNRQGGLAREFSNHANVHVVTLADATNDRSLVMTSSFTNLALGARSLGMLKQTEQYRATCRGLGEIADRLLRSYLPAMADVGSRG